MTSDTANAGSLLLELLSATTSGHEFITPTKRIHDGDDLSFFLSSTAYRDLMIWLLQLNRSMFPSEATDGQVEAHSLDRPSLYSDSVQKLTSLVSELSALVEQAPPDQGPRRFGNVAFRTWYKLAEERLDGLLESHCNSVIQNLEEGQRSHLKDEIQSYLVGSFGSAQRLDYGTGHELSFLAFLGCLWKLGAFKIGEERAIVIGVIQPYLELIRRLVLTYTLEPAGSHGVWGLDDHSFIPYIFGSAQYGPAIPLSRPNIPPPIEGSLKSAPRPSTVTDKEAVSFYRKSNMYFSAIQFIYDVKKGPFWEHSPVLYDISGIKDGWAKINKGMLKMYAAEVLGKFPVVQHFGFGSLFRWEVDPEAVKMQTSQHAQQQPRAQSPMSVVPPAPAPGAGTKAPWARDATTATAPRSTHVQSMRAPWAPTQRTTPSGGETTTAPWAKKDTG